MKADKLIPVLDWSVRPCKVLNELSVFFDISISHELAGTYAAFFTGITTTTVFAGVPAENVNLKKYYYVALINVSVPAFWATADTN